MIILFKICCTPIREYLCFAYLEINCQIKQIPFFLNN